MDAQKPISFVDHLDPPDEPWLPPVGRPPRGPLTPEARARVARERKVQRVIDDERKRRWIEDGNETRQPPEYRGRVFDHPDHEGVHPTAFPPLRDSPQDSLSDEFIAFQTYNQTTYAKNPEYYCVTCKIRYNARDGGQCGPCLGKARAEAARQTPLFPDLPRQITFPEYPD